MKSTNTTDQFYNWFKNLGGNLSQLNQDIVNKSILNIPLQYSSTLKLEPKKTKEKHNYKFKVNHY